MTHLYQNFEQYVLDSVAAALGIPYSAFAYTAPPLSPEMQRLHETANKATRRAIEEWHRRRERIAAVWLFGYDPQMLLEDHRND